TIITTFDVWAASLPPLEIYGTQGSLSVPDPNGFAGPVRVQRLGELGAWHEVPLTHAYLGNRGIGVADMAYALRARRLPRAGGQAGVDGGMVHGLGHRGGGARAERQDAGT